MGNWGYKTFENDGACDTLGHVFDDLVRQARRDVKKLSGKASLERPLLALVAILAAIVQKIDSPTHSLKKEEVEEWRAKYLCWLESYHEILGEDFLAWRRNANQEFSRLAKNLQG